MATRNSKTTSRSVVVPRNQFDALQDDICDASSLMFSALRYLEQDDFPYDGSDILAVRTLIAESHKRLSEVIEPLSDLIQPPVKRVKEAA